MEIIIVDDSKTPLLKLSQKLSSLGYRIQSFLDPTECAARLDDLHPNLFILDIEMPKINGIELCRMIKAKPHLSDVPVLFFSSADAEVMLKEAFDAGGFDFLPKIVTDQEMELRVRNALEIARLRLNEQTRALTFEILLRVIYHDLATPTMLAHHRIGAVAEAVTDPDLRAKLKVADRALTNISRATADMRAFFTSQTLDIDCRMQNVQKTIELLFADRLADKNVRLSWVIEESATQTMAIPETFLANQIVANFLSNALKFSYEGGLIELSCTYAEDHAEIRIQDHGRGMPPAKVQALLDGGLQITNLGTSGETGTGSGTMIARFFLDWFKCGFSVASKERTANADDGGTTIQIRVPLRAAAASETV